MITVTVRRRAILVHTCQNNLLAAKKKDGEGLPVLSLIFGDDSNSPSFFTALHFNLVAVTVPKEKSKNSDLALKPGIDGMRA